MSALGQKQTYAVQDCMPALPPKANVTAIEIPVRSEHSRSRRRLDRVSFVMNGNTSSAAALTDPFWRMRQIGCAENVV